MQYVLVMIALLLSFGQGNTQPEKAPQIDLPPPDKPLSVKEATKIYQSTHMFYSIRHSQGLPLYPLPEVYIQCFERILLDFPDEKFVFVPKGLGMRERVEYGGCRAALAASHWAQGKWNEALALEVQDLFIRWVENLEMKSGLLYGFPLYPFPDPFRSDPPAAVLRIADIVKEKQGKGAKFSPLLFIRSWCLRARWKGSDPNDALVSFNDLAYALGNDRWQEIIQRDWKAWRFTISVKGKTITFAAGSQKAVIEGKEVTLRYPVERSFYDLYVPLGDLVKALGGAVRPPKPEELTVFQRHLPVSLLVVDLD